MFGGDCHFGNLHQINTFKLASLRQCVGTACKTNGIRRAVYFHIY